MCRQIHILDRIGVGNDAITHHDPIHIKSPPAFGTILAFKSPVAGAICGSRQANIRAREIHRGHREHAAQQREQPDGSDGALHPHHIRRTCLGTCIRLCFYI